MRNVKYPMDAALSAALAAQRINGAYIKWDGVTVDENDKLKHSNKVLMMQALTTNPEMVNDEDRAAAGELRRYFRRYVFALLSGDRVSPYERSIADFIDNEETRSPLELGIIASLPQAWQRGMAQRTVKERIDFARGGLIGTPGQRLELTAEILQCFYSRQWMCYFVTAITPQDQVLRWSTTIEVKPGSHVSVRGTVKNHQDGQTKLGRVKLMQKETA